MKDKLKKKILYSPTFLIAAVIIGIVFLIQTIGLISKQQLTLSKKKLSKDELLELEIQKKSLEYDISTLKTEDGQEKKIREEFGLTKEGEGVILIVNKDNQEETVTQKSKNGGFWDFLKSLFSR